MWGTKSGRRGGTVVVSTDGFSVESTTANGSGPVGGCRFEVSASGLDSDRDGVPRPRNRLHFGHRNFHVPVGMADPIVIGPCRLQVRTSVPPDSFLIGTDLLGAGSASRATATTGNEGAMNFVLRNSKILQREQPYGQ